MGFLLRKFLFLSAFAALAFFASCEEHKVGEMPEVQKEQVYPMSSAQSEPVLSPAQTPEVKPTPADFFPETKPQ